MDASAFFMVNINSKLYFKAFSEKWIGSLAIYAKMQQLHSSKNFYFKKGEKTKVINELALEMGIKPSTLQKHLSILQSKNIVFFKHNCIKLASNKEINQWNATIKFVTIPESITTLKQIKIFRRNSPAIKFI